MSEIISIVYRPDTAPRDQESFRRVPLQQARLVTGHGIEGDQKGGREHRQLNIMAQETLDYLATLGFQSGPGQLGEQIIVHGLPVDLNQQPAGTRLQLGATAIVEITKLRTGCRRFSAIQGQPAEIATGLLGVMARVIEGGIIRPGDHVRIV